MPKGFDGLPNTAPGKGIVTERLALSQLGWVDLGSSDLHPPFAGPLPPVSFSVPHIVGINNLNFRTMMITNIDICN